MKALFYKDGKTLKPSSMESERYLSKMGQGEDCLIEITRPRNLRFHKKFMAFCAFIAEHATGYSAYTVAKLLEIKTGHCDPVKLPDGTITYIPREINFGAMDDAEFAKLFEDCIKYAGEEIAPWITDPEAADEFERFLV